jgi:hypothetical protein
MTNPAARVIAHEAWAKLLWAGLKLQAADFGNVDKPSSTRSMPRSSRRR